MNAAAIQNESEPLIPNFDAWIERLAAMRRSVWSGLGVGLLLFALAFGVRVLMGDALGPFPFLTFFPAIILTALIGGVRPAIVVSVLSGMSAWYYFIQPYHSWDLPQHGAVGLAFFGLVAGIDIVLIEGMQRAVMRLRDERKRASALIDAREAMFKELQHRVANNMQFVSGLLAMQQRRVDGTPAGDALEQAVARLRAMSRIHRRLYDPANADRAFGPLVEELCHELLEATGAKNIVCRVEIPDVRLPIDRVVALSMIVTEALTNAVKHAFDPEQHGTIRIALTAADGAAFDFVIADDGRGLPEGFDVARSPSLGMRIVQSLAQQLGGEFTYARAMVGSEMRLRFAAP